MTELDEVVRTSVRYASDAVLANAQAVADDIKDRTSDSPIQTRDPRSDKTWRRYEALRD